MNFKYTFRLSSPLEITDAAKKPLPDYAEKAARSNPYAPRFVGGVTYHAAADMASNGWPDAPKLGSIAEKIAPAETRTNYEMLHAVTGSFVDVARFIEGHPECMMEFADEPTPRTLSLAIRIGKGADVTAQQMELAGAVALAVIDTLARSGMRTDLTGYATANTSRCATLTTFPLKRAHEPADENQLAYWLCHPSAHRLLIFGFWDTCPAEFYRATSQDSGRGRSEDAPAESIGCDYVLSCSPSTEEQARREYHRIISEIQNTI